MIKAVRGSVRWAATCTSPKNPTPKTPNAKRVSFSLRELFDIINTLTHGTLPGTALIGQLTSPNYFAKLLRWILIYAATALNAHAAGGDELL